MHTIFTNVGEQPDAIVIKNSSYPFIDENFFYLTGLEQGIYEGSLVFVYPDGTLDLVVPELEAESAKKAQASLHVYKGVTEYKEIIKRAAKKYGFDWRLIASMIYQESHFDPKARSSTGVEGIMQLTKTTAGEMGIKDRLDTQQSIMGGVKYLKKLYDRYQDIQDPDRMLIALASYNVGYGHILDARKIAKERNLNPNSWAALEQVLPLLRYRKYYKKTRYGYCRGTEPVRYVNRILTYYDILKREAIS